MDGWGGGSAAAAVERRHHHTILRKKKYQTECGNLRGIALTAHAGEVLTKTIDLRLSDYYCIAKGKAYTIRRTVRLSSPGFGYPQSVRRPQLVRACKGREDLPPHDVLNRSSEKGVRLRRSGPSAWTALARYGMALETTTTNDQFHDDMRV